MCVCGIAILAKLYHINAGHIYNLKRLTIIMFYMHSFQSHGVKMIHLDMNIYHVKND